MKDTGQRYLDKQLEIDDENLFVRVFQIALNKYGTQHILVLTSSVGSSQPAQISDDDKQAAFEFLNLFTYLATSMYLDKAEVIDFMRRRSTEKAK